MRSRTALGALFLAWAMVTGCASRSGWGEFDGRAEAVCSEGNYAITALGAMPEVGAAGASAYMFSLATIQARIARRLANLDMPEGDHRVFTQLVARLESLVGKSREHGALIRAGEASLDAEMREAAIDAQNAAFDLGLTECARFGLP